MPAQIHQKTWKPRHPSPDGIDFEPPTLPAVPLIDEDTYVQPRRRKQFSVLTDDDGDVYFVDNATQETRWDLPEDGDVVEI